MNFSSNFVSECLENTTYAKHVAAPLFRKSFNIDFTAESAKILICGLGFYDLYINGEKITKGFLAPYISNSDHICYYDEYDLLEYLKKGENVIGIMLGDGFQNGKTCVWNFADNIMNSAPKLALSFEAKGENKEISFDASDFKCKKGPYTFNCLRSGVFFDKRLEEKGWNDTGFTEKDWHEPIKCPKPRGKAKLCESEPIVITKEIKPVSVRPGELADYAPRPDVVNWMKNFTPQENPPARTGGYIYDFGENNAGIFRLKIKGEKGQRIDIQCGEKLIDGKLSYQNIAFYPDGYSQRDIYILNGEGEEIFEPQFTYHGFRYLYISGITEKQATKDLVTYLVMSSDLKKRGSFSCSDETSNKIFEAALRSDISNFYYFPTDCPHREKNGWTGDASISSEHMILTIEPEHSWREWLNNIRLAQTPEGMLPGIIPTDKWGYEWGNGPAWDSVIFNLPYMTYKYRGTTQLITENAHAMIAYLEYISRKRDERGIVEIGLGDWVPVGRGADDYEAPLGFTDSLMVLDMCRKAKIMFDAVNLNAHSKFAEELADEFYKAIRKEYIDFNTMTVQSCCQTAQAAALYFDLFEPGEKAAAFERLLKIVHNDGDSITSGFLGLRVIFHVLADFGYADLAYKMITKKEYPSYGHWIANGETTLLEHFLPNLEDFPESKNHHFLGDVSHWYIRVAGGINVISSERVKIKPHFISDLSFAEASHILPAGEVKTSWKRTKDKIELTVSSPDSIRCEIELENGYIFEDTALNFCRTNKLSTTIIKKH